MNKINKITLIFMGAIISLSFVINFAVISCDAQNLSDWESNLEIGGKTAGYNPEIQAPDPFIAVLIKTVLSFLGVLFLILMIYGGVLWMTARGKEEQVTKARDLIIAAVIGLIIVLASYAISIFVINALSENTLNFT